ncbi:uncharacterized protein N7482_000161 [Penicillium canariense]|uniref:DUF1740-domain-containing protein n=1 Tax=Penicillium canariense TaxID=189055 RepID=A0A9W9IDP7_9EURO|nr:uncharacterized protein N7482_000161 [Penicillium canariense]KAJ5174284.1 hypothetical protein N7482_000161 [Penicillium canariense]
MNVDPALPGDLVNESDAAPLVVALTLSSTIVPAPEMIELRGARASSVQPRSGDAELYAIDLKGDRFIITYGTSHRYEVPSYRRVGFGQVLGVATNLVIDRNQPDIDSVVLRPKGTATAKDKASQPLSKLLKQPTQLYRLRKSDDPSSIEDWMNDTIQLSSSISGKPGTTADDGGSDDERHAYRSILGKAKDEDMVPSDMELVSGQENRDDDFRVSFDAERRARNADLLRAVDSNPKDVAAWLRLIDHQNTLVLGAGEDSRQLTAAERRSVADVKMSLYDKALKKSGDAIHRDFLLLGRLQDGGQVWDRKKLLAEWNTTLKKNTESISLQVKYLDFRQTDFQDFSLDECKELFIDCMKCIDANPNYSRHSQVQCYLLLRLTLLLREAGYAELAVGFWQAVLEFSCFRSPSLLETQHREAVLQFSEFWDSEVARIGEAGGTGWRSGTSPKVDPVNHHLRVHVDPSTLFPSWRDAERARIQLFQMPARSLDEYGADVDTAYSVVLGSDFHDILPSFWGDTVCEYIIDAFLYFCHLPHLTVPSNLKTTRLWSGDNFLRNEFVASVKSKLSDWVPSEVDGSRTSVSPFSFPVANFLHTTETLFAPEKWFYSLQSWSKAIFDTPSFIDFDWARRTLRSLVDRFDQDCELAEYALAVEFACDREAATKFGKRLLKTRSSKLRLYNAFALMQWRSDKQDLAVELPGVEKLNCGLLWNTWAWEVLQSGDFRRASYLLHAMSLEEVDLTAFHAAIAPNQYNPTERLRTQKFLQETCHRALAHRESQVYAAYTDCLGLLLYISDRSLGAALDAYSAAVLELRNLPPDEENYKAFTAELLHQARARLIYFHVSQNREFKPLQIHTFLKESISLFPHNTMFLSLFMWNELRFPIFDRVRDPLALINADPERRYQLHEQSALPIIIPQRVPVSTHLFSIYMELCRPVFTGGTIHSVRAAFERAIGEHSNSVSNGADDKVAGKSFDGDSARSNLTIWKLYMLFELDRAQDIKAAKAVFYRAIRACPWSKELPMLAFERLGGQQQGLSFDDLRELYNVLDEKQLRIHVDISKELKEATVQSSKEDADMGAKGQSEDGEGA